MVQCIGNTTKFIAELYTFWTDKWFINIIINAVLVNPLFAVAFYPISYIIAHLLKRSHTYGQVSKSLVSFTVAFPLPFLVFSFVNFTEASCVGIFFRLVSFLVAAIFSASFLSLPSIFCLFLASI